MFVLISRLFARLKLDNCSRWEGQAMRHLKDSAQLGSQRDWSWHELKLHWARFERQCQGRLSIFFFSIFEIWGGGLFRYRVGLALGLRVNRCLLLPWASTFSSAVRKSSSLKCFRQTREPSFGSHFFPSWNTIPICSTHSLLNLGPSGNGNVCTFSWE